MSKLTILEMLEKVLSDRDDLLDIDEANMFSRTEVQELIRPIEILTLWLTKELQNA